jgi:uncharacterized protein YjbI with pentapeptide repeats
MKNQSVLGSVSLLFFIVMFCGGCSSSDFQPASDPPAQGIVERDFFNDPGLHANPEQGVVAMFLEHADAPKEDNLTGTLGVDIIPYHYTKATTQTFCWEDRATWAVHRMVLKDGDGLELLSADVNGECQTISLEKGKYYLHLYHDNQSQDTHTVFIRPRDTSQELAQNPGLFEKMMAWLGVFNPTGTAVAGTPEQDLQTLLTTWQCIDCDLEGMNLDAFDSGCGDNENGWVSLAGSNLDNAKVDISICNASLANISGKNADFSGGYFWGCLFSDSDLTGANMEYVDLYGAGLSNTDMTDVDLTGSNLEFADLTKAWFTDAILDKANLKNVYGVGTVEFAGASLRGTILSGLDLSVPGLLTLLDATGADFSGATISGIGMISVNFTNADFTDADLSNFSCVYCTLRGANLTGANVTDAAMDFTGATWTDGVCVCSDFSCSNC